MEQILKRIKERISQLNQTGFFKIACVCLLITCLITGGIGIYQYNRANTYAQRAQQQYSRALHETADYLKSIDALLQKSLVVTTPEQMTKLSMQLYQEAMAAKGNLGQLPITDVNLETTSRFLSQVGDYTYFLSKNMQESGSISDEQYHNLESLAGHAVKLQASVNELCNQLYQGDLVIERVANSKTNIVSAEESEFLTELGNVEKEFMEYPALIYDGPFSSHIEKREPKNAPAGVDIGLETAKMIASYYVGIDRVKSIEYTGPEDGVIGCYTFQIVLDDSFSEPVSVYVAKASGYILMMLRNRSVSQQNISFEEACATAQEFLDARGMDHMKQSYYETDGGIATINFAYMQNDITMYPDLIKVKVALDNGEVLGVEARGYIMSHVDDRALPAPTVSAADARAAISSRLAVKQQSLALIATDAEREILCYEFLCELNGNEFLIYINAYDRSEEEVLLLLKSDSGILTI